jgi:hypothetical protein
MLASMTSPASPANIASAMTCGPIARSVASWLARKLITVTCAASG